MHTCFLDFLDWFKFLTFFLHVAATSWWRESQTEAWKISPWTSLAPPRAKMTWHSKRWRSLPASLATTMARALQWLPCRLQGPAASGAFVMCKLWLWSEVLVSNGVCFFSQINELASFFDSPATSVTRVLYTDKDVQARRWHSWDYLLSWEQATLLTLGWSD